MAINEVVTTRVARPLLQNVDWDLVQQALSQARFTAEPPNQTHVAKSLIPRYSAVLISSMRSLVCRKKLVQSLSHGWL